MADLKPEQERMYNEFLQEQAREFEKKMEEKDEILQRCESLSHQRQFGFVDPAPEQRRGTVLDKMCAKISALEAENADLRDMARRMTYVMQYLSANEPLILHRITVAFGHDGQHRNLFMEPYEYVPPWLVERCKVLSAPVRMGMSVDGFDEAFGKDAPEGVKRHGGSGNAGEGDLDVPDYDAEYGWLSPYGKFHHVPWSEHSIWAERTALELGYAKEGDFNPDPDDPLANLHYADEVMRENQWCLIHSPLHDEPMHHEGKLGLTKLQRDYLYDMYIRCKMDDAASALYKDEPL